MATKEISKKATRSRLTLGQQAEIVGLLRNGRNAAHIMNEFGVSRRTVSNIKKAGDTMLQRGQDPACSHDSKTYRPPHFLDIENKLYAFVSLARTHKLRVTCSMLQERALKIREATLNTDLSKAEREKLESFTASKGWVSNFAKRRALRSVSLSGEAANADATEEAAGIKELREKLRGYDVHNIFTVEQTCLFFKLLPRKTYTGSVENRKSVQDTTAMKANDRITAYVCTNAAGLKVPLCVIGAEKNPSCFRIETSSVHYLHQKDAWSDSTTFRHWFNEVFLPFVRQITPRRVALVIDIFGPHGTDLKDSKGQIAIYTLPSSSTAVHQPMNLGIITTLKRTYRGLLLMETMNDLETRQTRRDESAALRRDMKGLREGYDPHMLDVTRMIHKSWELVSDLAVCRTWVEANVLPAEMNVELTEAFDKMTSTPSHLNVQDMVQLITKFPLKADRRDPFYDQVCPTTNAEDVERWLDIENDSDIQEALVDDDMQVVDEQMPQGQPHRNGNVTADQSKSGVEVATLPPREQILSRLDALEESALKSNVNGAIRHLRKARSAFMDAKRLEDQRLEKQRLEKQRLEKQMLEKQRLENQSLENQMLENQMLENQMLENQMLENQGVSTDPSPAQPLSAQPPSAQPSPTQPSSTQPGTSEVQGEQSPQCQNRAVPSLN